MDDVYIEVQQITTHYLGIIGFFLNGFIWPVHCRVYWNKNGKWFMSELADSPDNNNYEIVGRGDGYDIYVYRMPFPRGTKVGQVADSSVFDAFARKYAGVEKGNLNSSSANRDWYDQPQGYGGPMYDACTSNTYANWLLSQCGLTYSKPHGAFGWESKPEFPGPRRHGLHG